MKKNTTHFKEVNPLFIWVWIQLVVFFANLIYLLYNKLKYYKGVNKMYVRKIKSNKGIREIAKKGIQYIDVVDNKTNVYTAGGNIFVVNVKQILQEDKFVSNSKNYHKNLY